MRHKQPTPDSMCNLVTFFFLCVFMFSDAPNSSSSAGGGCGDAGGNKAASVSTNDENTTGVLLSMTHVRASVYDHSFLTLFHPFLSFLSRRDI